MVRFSEDDLNAYIDGALDRAAAFEIAAALAREPKKAARAEAYAAQGLALGALYDHVAAQPVPDRLLAVFRRHAARTNRRRFLEAAAVAGLLLAALAAGGRTTGIMPRPHAPAPISDTVRVPV